MRNWTSLILRLAFGGMMLTHGYGKLMMLISGEISFPRVLGLNPIVSLVLAVFSEFVCSILVVIGFRTKISVVPLIVTMVIAAFVIHSGDPFNEREMSLLYLAGYVSLLLLGGGKYAVKRD